MHGISHSTAFCVRRSFVECTENKLCTCLNHLQFEWLPVAVNNCEFELFIVKIILRPTLANGFSKLTGFKSFLESEDEGTYLPQHVCLHVNKPLVCFHCKSVADGNIKLDPLHWGFSLSIYLRTARLPGKLLEVKGGLWWSATYVQPTYFQAIIRIVRGFHIHA